MPDVHVDQHKVGLQQGLVPGVMQVDVQHLAVAAPVAAKVQQNALVGGGGGFERGRDLGLRLPRIGIDVAAGRAGGADGQRQSGGENKYLYDLHGCLQRFSFYLIPLSLPLTQPRIIFLRRSERLGVYPEV